MHHLNAALRAHAIYKRDVEYIVRDGEVIIVDEFTGRTMPGRRWSDGLHQAVEAKEGVKVRAENQTVASITFQNYFRLYKKLSGMTGTADTEAPEFMQIYGLEVVVIPTHRPMIRKDNADFVYLTQDDKFKAIIEDIEDCVTREQPVLVGTTSIETSELLSGVLKENGIPHEVLNAKQHEREAHIVENAGMPGKVTIATNMAGRGTDIKLGGNNEAELEQAAAAAGEAGLDEVTAARIRADWQARHDKVVAAGGLHIIGTERHESRRIDNQLRGRSGRQGDPGSSRFYLSMEDNLMRIFGDPNRTKKWLAHGRHEGRRGHRERHAHAPDREGAAQGRGAQLRHPQAAAHLRRRGQRSAQGHLPAAHRAHGRRPTWPTRSAASAPRSSAASSTSTCRRTSATRNGISTGLAAAIAKNFATQVDPAQWLKDQPELEESTLRGRVIGAIDAMYDAKVRSAIGVPIMRHVEKDIMLKVLDQQWRDHLGAMDYLRQGIHLRGYAQKDYRYEYKREAFELFAAMLERIKFDTVTILATLDVQVKSPEQIEREEEARRARLNRALQAQHAEAASLAQLGAAGAKSSPSRRRRPPGARARAAPPHMPQAGAAAGARRAQGRAQPAVPVRQRQEIQELPRRARGSRVACSSSKPRLRVVAAALFDRGRVLIAERPAGKHMAGWWEFPGGKVARRKRRAGAGARAARRARQSMRSPTRKS